VIQGLPTISVEIGFTAGAGTGTYLHLDDISRGLLDTGTLAPDDLFTDVSTYVHNFTTRRGSNRVEGPVVRYEAGTATISLNNSDRRFDPTNLSGPYVSGGVTQITPMRVVRIRVAFGGGAGFGIGGFGIGPFGEGGGGLIVYDLFRGYADAWQIGYRQPSYSEVVLTATDGFKVLESYDRAASGSVGASEDSGARVSRILNSAAWEISDRLIAVGDTTVQATTLEGTALTELYLVVDTEIGEGYIDGAGRYVFRNRNALLEDFRSNTPQATFGDGGGDELPYENITVEYDDEQLTNLVRIARDGGAVQTAQDTTSQIQYLVHTFDRSDLLMETDTVAADYAAFILAASKDPELRIATLTVNPLRDPDNLFPQVLGREIGDRITIKLRPPGGGSTIERDVLIRGIEHAATPQTWSTIWTLQDAPTESFLILDHTVHGKLNSNVLAF
jgi:hypothetical protein